MKHEKWKHGTGNMENETDVWISSYSMNTSRGQRSILKVAIWRQTCSTQFFFFGVGGRGRSPFKCVFLRLSGLGAVIYAYYAYVCWSAWWPQLQLQDMYVFLVALRLPGTKLGMLGRHVRWRCKKWAPGVGGGKGFLSLAEPPSRQRLRDAQEALLVALQKLVPGVGGGRGVSSLAKSARANRLASNHIRPPAPASALRHSQCIGSPLAGGEYTSYMIGGRLFVSQSGGTS